MRLLGQLTLGQQLPDGLGCEPIAGAHGGMAGHQAEQVVEQLLAAGHSLLVEQVIDHGAQHRRNAWSGDAPASGQ
jgi:hypothetical protein